MCIMNLVMHNRNKRRILDFQGVEVLVAMQVGVCCLCGRAMHPLAGGRTMNFAGLLASSRLLFGWQGHAPGGGKTMKFAGRLAGTRLLFEWQCHAPGGGRTMKFAVLLASRRLLLVWQ